MEEIIVAKKNGYILILNNKNNEYRIFSDEFIELNIGNNNEVKISVPSINVKGDKVQEVVDKINNAVIIARYFTKIINEHNIAQQK